MPRTTEHVSYFSVPQSVRSHSQVETCSLFSLFQSAHLSAREQLSSIHNTPTGAGAFLGPAAHILDWPRRGEAYRGMLQERLEKVPPLPERVEKQLSYGLGHYFDPSISIEFSRDLGGKAAADPTYKHSLLLVIHERSNARSHLPLQFLVDDFPTIRSCLTSLRSCIVCAPTT